MTVDGVRALLVNRTPKGLGPLLLLFAGLTAVTFMNPAALFLGAWALMAIGFLGYALSTIVRQRRPRAIRISERELVLEWSQGGRTGGTRSEPFPLTEVEALRVRHDKDLLLKTTEETRVLYVGEAEVAEWLVQALQEAKDARERRETKDRPEYRFEQVVPEAVERLLD